jgi:hypothetical protein
MGTQRRSSTIAAETLPPLGYYTGRHDGGWEGFWLLMK